MPERTCPACGERFTPSTHNQRYCPPTAEDRERAGRRQAVSRCARRATNLAQRGGRVDALAHRGKPGQVFDCAYCGKRCTPGVDVSPHATRFCCAKHKAYWHTPRRTRRERAEAKLARAAEGQPASCVWIDCTCAECGHRFLTRKSSVRFCSRRCKGRVRKRLRRIAGGKTRMGLWQIAERDGWTCQLCGLPVGAGLRVPHPAAATVDHVVPLALGGTHEASNLQLAHFMCNSKKGDGRNRAVGAQMSLA